MGATYNELRAAIGTSLDVYIPGLSLNTYAYVPRTVIPPAAIVQPTPQRTADNLVAMASSMAEWHFDIMVVIGQIDEEAAQQQAGDAVSPNGPLIRALNNTRLPGTGYALVTRTGVRSAMFDQGLYVYADISLTILA